MNPGSENFIGTKISNAILEGLKFLFVPDTEEIQDKFNKIKDKFTFYFDVKAMVKDLEDSITFEENTPIFYIKVGQNKYFEGQVQVINLEWYKPYKEYGDVIFCCFAYAFFFWRVFIKLSSIIRGDGGNVEVLKEGKDKK